jgi:acyl transferase domain-containing protein
VVSARSAERLRVHCGRLAQALRRDRPHLTDVAWTLQTGREAFEHRAAVWAEHLDEAVDALEVLATGGSPEQPCWTGAVPAGSTPQPVITHPDADRRTWEQWAQAWTAGAAVEWATAWPDDRPPLAELPAYPFSPDRYWLPEEHTHTPPSGSQPFTVRLTPGDAVLADHVVQDVPVLPGAAQLELAREAAARSRPDERVAALTDVVWVRPAAGAEQRIRVDLTAGPDHAGFVVRDAEGTKFSQGRVLFGDATGDTAPVDLAAVLARCDKRRDGTSAYRAFEAAGLHYGPLYRAVQNLHSGAGEAVAELHLADAGQWVMHPGLLDAAFQSVTGLLPDGVPGDPAPLHVPFAVRRVEVLGPLPVHCFAIATWSGGRRPDDGTAAFDITVTDPDGRRLIVVHGLTLRRFRPYGSSSSGPPRLCRPGTARSDTWW